MKSYNASKLPAFRLKDPTGLKMKYRQRFVEEIRILQPKIFEELREYAPNFEILFRNATEDKSISILNEIKRVDSTRFYST